MTRYHKWPDKRIVCLTGLQAAVGQPAEEEGAMTAIDIPVELAQIACEICLSEVPLSKAENPEVEDYVAHFWGLECFEIWKHQDGNP